MQHPAIPIALEAVASAMSITRAVQARVEAVAGHLKDDRSPVTVADYAAQAIVSMVLREGIDDPALHRIVGEEDTGDLSKTENAPVRAAVTQAVQSWRPGATEPDVMAAIDACNHDASGDVWWTLDPVDGTKGFLRGGQYAIALGCSKMGSWKRAFSAAPTCPLTLAETLQSLITTAQGCCTALNEDMARGSSKMAIHRPLGCVSPVRPGRMTRPFAAAPRWNHTTPTRDRPASCWQGLRTRR